MAKYLYRTCPKCKDYFGVVVPEPPEPVTEVPIDAHCAVCGFKLAWKVLTGGKSIVALLWLVLFLLPLYTPSVHPLGERQAQYHTVRRVVDGDTLVLENKERVRLIGVDTPETKHPRKPVEYYGKEATAFTKKMVQGKRVRLEFDQANSHIGRFLFETVFQLDFRPLPISKALSSVPSPYARTPFLFDKVIDNVNRKGQQNH